MTEQPGTGIRSQIGGALAKAVGELGIEGELPDLELGRGDVDRAFQSAKYTIEGELKIGGQEHFYLESQVAICQPGEHGQMVVHSSTQHPSEVQSIVSEALGVRSGRSS